jgi:hypothetical protein
VICIRSQLGDAADDVIIGEWDPRSDEVHRPLKLPRSDFQKLFAVKGDLPDSLLSLDRTVVRDLYDRLAPDNISGTQLLSEYRESYQYEAYLVGEVVEGCGIRTAKTARNLGDGRSSPRPDSSRLRGSRMTPYRCASTSSPIHRLLRRHIRP